MNHEKDTKHWLRKLLLIGATLLLGTMGLYFYKFAPGHWFELSSSPEQWNHFGTFVGGVAGPCFGFMAFFAAVETILMQARQLDLAHQQALAGDLQRVLNGLSDRIEKQLEEELKPALGQSFQTVRYWISEFAAEAAWRDRTVAQLEGVHRHLTEISNSEKTKSSVKPLLKNLDSVLKDLDAICWCLERHKLGGGDVSDLQEFYRYRYADVVSKLQQLKLIPKESKVPILLGSA